MTVGSLFAGIGGFDLGFERAGFTTTWQVEINPFCRSVLEKHWPNVQRFTDVTECCGGTEHGRRDWLPYVDVVCGGFPCQDISSAGKKVGISGARSGLWAEFARLVCEIRPRYVVVENSASINARGLGRVLGDLAACGYDAEWECLPIGLFGAPHLRARAFVVGYAHRNGQPISAEHEEASWMPALVANAERAYKEARADMAGTWGDRESLPWDATGQCIDPTLAVRVDDGLSHRMDRLSALGNAVSPQITEWIARRIAEHEATA